MSSSNIEIIIFQILQPNILTSYNPQAWLLFAVPFLARPLGSIFFGWTRGGGNAWTQTVGWKILYSIPWYGRRACSIDLKMWRSSVDNGHSAPLVRANLRCHELMRKQRLVNSFDWNCFERNHDTHAYILYIMTIYKWTWMQKPVPIISPVAVWVFSCFLQFVSLWIHVRCQPVVTTPGWCRALRGSPLLECLLVYSPSLG